jgi:hypothetical protein
VQTNFSGNPFTRERDLPIARTRLNFRGTEYLLSNAAHVVDVRGHTFVLLRTNFRISMFERLNWPSKAVCDNTSSSLHLLRIYKLHRLGQSSCEPYTLLPHALPHSEWHIIIVPLLLDHRGFSNLYQHRPVYVTEITH